MLLLWKSTLGQQLLSSLKADSFEAWYVDNLSYCHFCLAVGDKVRLWEHVASGVQLLLYDAEFLWAVARSESQRLLAVPGPEHTGAGGRAGAVAERLGAVALGAFVLVSILLCRQLSWWWAVGIAWLRLHIHSFHGKAALGCHLDHLSTVAVEAVVSFLC